MSKPKLALIPSGYKSGKVYSILPNDATGDFDFTRQSIGTRVRKDGLIEEAKTVGSITNRLTRSEEFDNATWIKVSSSVTADEELAPNGTNTAEKLFDNTDNNRHFVYQNGTGTSGLVYTFSCYMKKGSLTESTLAFNSALAQHVVFDLENGTVISQGANIDSSEIVPLANDWYRCSFTHTATASNLLYRVGTYDGSITYVGTGTDYIYIWGAMLSEGALSDYIKTEGTTETKTVETFTDVPRLDWLNSNCPSLLLEPQRTNYATNNTSMDTYSTLGGSSPSPTLTADYTIAPDGTLTATRLQISKTGTNYSLISFPTTSDDGSGGGYYTTSVYVKSNTGSSQEIAFYGQSSSPNTRTVTTEWSRIQFTGQRLGNTKYAYLGAINGTDDDIDISIWGAQIELVDSYPSSLIYTGASTVTRLVDSCEVASGLENLINQTEGVFYIEFEYLYETTTDSSTDANRDILVLGTASDISEGISIDNFRSQFRVFIQGSGMTTQNVGNNTTGSSQPNTRYKLAVNYKSGDNKAYLNGSLLGSVQTGDVNFVTNLDGIFFSYNSSSRPFKNQKKVYDLRVYDTALTDNELIELTTL